jgi:hypothetical protein
LAGLYPHPSAASPTQDRLGRRRMPRALPLVQHQRRQQDQRRLAGLDRPHDHPLGRGVGERRHGADPERAGLGGQQGQDVGQAVGAVDQGDGPALAHGLQAEGGPGRQPAVGHPGAGLLRGGRAQGAGVVEERRIADHRVEHRQVQGPEAALDVAADDLDAILQAVERGIAPRQVGGGGIALQSDESGARTPGRRRQQRPADAAAGLDHPLARRSASQAAASRAASMPAR